MTFQRLAAAYLEKARKRLKILRLLLDDDAFSDVVRDAQEVVELCQKAMLRQVGIDPPRLHDVSAVLLRNADRFPSLTREDLSRAAEISSWLRAEREPAFCGDVEFIPTEEYDRDTAERAVADASWLVALTRRVVTPDCG